MGVPLGTVRSRLSRARQALQHMINPAVSSSSYASEEAEPGGSADEPPMARPNTRRVNGVPSRRRESRTHAALRRHVPAKA
jgi:hypothetical protein